MLKPFSYLSNYFSQIGTEKRSQRFDNFYKTDYTAEQKKFCTKNMKGMRLINGPAARLICSNFVKLLRIGSSRLEYP